jgi:NADH-quinone oxidoreductase subunit J
MFDIIFYIFGAITLIGGFVTATAKNLIYAAFGMLFTFAGVAGLYVMANADFLAVTQVMVYVGGILILLIFGVMLTNRVSNANITISGGSKWMMTILALGIFAILMMAYFGTGSTASVKTPDGKSKTVSTWIDYNHQPWAQSPWNKDIFNTVLAQKYGAPSEVAAKEGSQGTATEIGVLLLTDYLMPFEVISILILVALIGAAMIARKEPTPAEEAIAEAASI